MKQSHFEQVPDEEKESESIERNEDTHVQLHFKDDEDSIKYGTPNENEKQ